jgi:hypothetical protein
MGHPYPERSAEPIIMLSPASLPPRGLSRTNRRPTAEVLLSDQTWAPVTVLAWHHLNESLVQPLTGYRVTWLVQLRLTDGSESWYEYVSRNPR